MQVKNVVIINDYNYVQGGASKIAIDTARILFNAGINVYFFSAVNCEEKKIEGIKYFSTNQNEALKEKNKIKGCINGLYNIKARIELAKLLNVLDKNETLIHIHGWTKALSSSIFDICFKLKFKVVLTLHDYFFACPNGGFFNYKERKVCLLDPMSNYCKLKNCDSRNMFIKFYRIVRHTIQNKVVRVPEKIKHVIAISDFSEKILNKYIKNAKMYRVNNPIDIYRSKERVFAEKNNCYLFLGRISEEKGIRLFCKAVSNKKLNAIVIGDGPLRKELEKEYTNINFIGWKNKEEIYTYMQNARCLLFTSLWYETMGLTVLEAMGYGVPVICGDNCAAIEYISNQENGLIFEQGNLNKLIDVLNKTESNELIRRLSTNAYKFLENNFKDGIYEKEILKAYLEI